MEQGVRTALFCILHKEVLHARKFCSILTVLISVLRDDCRSLLYLLHDSCRGY